MSDRAEIAERLSAIALKARDVQAEHGRPYEGPFFAIADAAQGLHAGDGFTKQDIVILRGMISARSYEKTPYHEAIVPVLQEALDVLEALTVSK